MKILELQAENFKKIRVVEIRPDRALIQVTGKNGTGKTSTLDAIWFALKGKKALPAKPAVREGASTMKVTLKIGPSNAKEILEFTVTRSLGADSETPTLDIKMLKGKLDDTPQAFLDKIFDELTFDPLEFVGMDPEAQVAKLKETAKVSLDFEALALADDTDYKARTAINKEIKALEMQINSATVLEGLPAEKIDEAAILAKLDAAGEANRMAQEVFRARQDLGARAEGVRIARSHREREIEEQGREIDRLRQQLEAAAERRSQMERELEMLGKALIHAENAYNAAPAGDPVDVAELSRELQDAQRTNRAIDARREYDNKKVMLTAKERESSALTRQLDQREEMRRVAVSKAKIPIEGLGFNKTMTQVTFNGLPIQNLGEGEQIRISALIGMASNPKLRVLCIRHGEALDDDGLQILAKLAEDGAR
jgi:chromosome segregation ATPase